MPLYIPTVLYGLLDPLAFGTIKKLIKYTVVFKSSVCYMSLLFVQSSLFSQESMMNIDKTSDINVCGHKIITEFGLHVMFRMFNVVFIQCPPLSPESSRMKL